jgi:ankyrin repeat protein
MSSAFRRTLPARPSLDQQKKLAKDLLRALRAGDPEAAARMRAELPDKAELSLTDAQYVLAREYGFASWRELTDQIEQRTVAQLPPIDRFKRAVHDGDANALRAVLERHADVRAQIDAPIFSFDSPALVTISGDHLAAIDVLLEFGADPNRRSDWWAGGFHPLYGKHGAAAERLIAAGAVPDACAAANLDRPDLLAAMIAEDPARVHERGGDGQTPLHFARSREVVDLLLAAGADPDARDVDHRSTAAQWMLGADPAPSRNDVAAYLVERGASADIFLAAALGLTDRVQRMIERDPSVLELRTSQGEYAEQPPSSYHIYQWTIGPNLSPLHAAAKFRRDETLAVIERFASPAERLLVACHRGDRDAARALIADRPDIMTTLGAAERGALAHEAWLDNARAVGLMLELGFDPAARSPNGGTALHCAAWMGSAECVDVILRYAAGRALVDVRDPSFDGTPLGWCTHGSRNSGRRSADYAGVARSLIAAGARIEPRMVEEDLPDELHAVIDEALRGGRR